ncbi:hypothetical protein FRB99_001103 [Tulasnella sp. 403]|nr:hypothetical protein FRB99_001103 [Tulasnella sp. 403]
MDPSHPGLFKVNKQPGDYNSSLVALKSFKAGDTICLMRGLTSGQKKYSTVQCGPNEHFELNSDLLYVNHSCEPNVAFDISSSFRQDWHVRALKDINAGNALTFFYPSTEWDMAQPFDCSCNSKVSAFED